MADLDTDRQLDDVAALLAAWRKSKNPATFAGLKAAAAAFTEGQPDPLDGLMASLLQAAAGEPDRERLAELSNELSAELGKPDHDPAVAAKLAGELAAGFKRGSTAEALVALEAELPRHEPIETHAPADWPTPPARQWILDGWLPAGRVTLFTGKGGAGKSLLTLGLALALAAGEEKWLGNQGKGSPRVRGGAGAVVWASWEDEPDEVWRRAQWIQDNQGKRPTKEHFVLADLAGRGPLWAPGADGKGSTHTSTLASLTPTGERLRALCEEREARLLVLDPLAAAYGSNENDRGLVRSFISSWDRWGRKHDCAVLIIAHPPKSAGGDEGVSYSGSTDWLGGPRSLWALEKDRPPKEGNKQPPGEALKLVNTKNNYAPDGGAVWLDQEDVEIDGQPVGRAFVETNPPPWRQESGPGSGGVDVGRVDGGRDLGRHAHAVA